MNEFRGISWNEGNWPNVTIGRWRPSGYIFSVRLCPWLKLTKVWGFRKASDVGVALGAKR